MKLSDIPKMIGQHVATDKLEQALHLSHDDAKALAPFVLELKRTLDNTQQERHMIRISLDNILVKAKPLLNTLKNELQTNEEFKGAAANVVAQIAEQGLERLAKIIDTLEI